MSLFVFVVVVFATRVVQAAPNCYERGPSPPVPSPRNCDTICTFLYDPLCGVDPYNFRAPTRVFSNECVMGVHNCVNKTRYVKWYDGQC